ncbi:MAG TPA: helix-turn-helix transcriptional regulator [Thermoanaerobaculia bacterium]|jgi:transcriptional regulator with XRE-family HTH domain|nr:helix-turn-helix transcriptional regulator [Thermoanaerobaculia bacterium]
MEKSGEHPDTLRLAVVFLRFYARKSQTGFGRAARLDQGQISRIELGQTVPSEAVLRRMAAAVGVSWPLFLNLRDFCAGFLSATTCRAGFGEEEDEPLDFGEPALLAVCAYLLEDAAAEAATSPPGAGFPEKGESTNMP